eukprot:Gregarina_sp_Pseudo_9__5166@NODE_553_length_2595_cov_4_174883_g522_i0_p4_GENE_NODE_553_length_2595_cov_4_174883_g522_i0NODE_553_length_2595_cov_4_174883_g522_i0_p4_ORF_typecomplete_len186_score49_00_NODE_553_length_2595_cov_4_174883_g522_i07891346
MEIQYYVALRPADFGIKSHSWGKVTDPAKATATDPVNAKVTDPTKAKTTKQPAQRGSERQMFAKNIWSYLLSVFLPCSCPSDAKIDEEEEVITLPQEIPLEYWSLHNLLGAEREKGVRLASPYRQMIRQSVGLPPGALTPPGDYDGMALDDVLLDEDELDDAELEGIELDGILFDYYDEINRDSD